MPTTGASASGDGADPVMARATSAALRPPATSTSAAGGGTDEKKRLFGDNAVLITSNILFFVLLAIGAAVVLARHNHAPPEEKPPPSVIAADSLPANRLIQASDLTVIEDTPKTAAKGGTDALSDEGAAARDKLVGRYVVVPIPRGKPLSAKMVADRPDLSLVGGVITLGLAVDRKDVSEGRLNAGTEVIACSGATEIGNQSYIVRAVLCPARGQSCVGLLALPPERRADAALFGSGLAPRLSSRACAAAP